VTAIRLKILVSAYACNPEEGSEPYVGWNLAREVAKQHEVWLLTRANNRAAIQAELAQKPAPDLHVVYFDLPPWARFWKKRKRGARLYYYLWQIAAYWVVRKLRREVEFDLAHHLTFATDWIPSSLAFLELPFVWGPIVGAQSASKAFRKTFSWFPRIQEAARSGVRLFGRFDPLMRWTARRTTLAVASSEEAKAHLLRLGCKRAVVLPSVGMSDEEINRLEPARVSERTTRVRFLSLGRLVAFKAVSLVVEAFAETRSCFPEAELWIIGDGPERRRLIALSEQLGIQHAIEFKGSLPRRELMYRLADCDALVYLCLRGANSMACLEAMAAGLPVICLDLGGPALQVNEKSGLKVKAESSQQVVSDLAGAMRLLAENPALRQRMGVAARERVRDKFRWEVRAEAICEIYAQALAERPEPGITALAWRQTE
jgi:glycosyltransferase involved in cell wall biosynthesis